MSDKEVLREKLAELKSQERRLENSLYYVQIAIKEIQRKLDVPEEEESCPTKK